MLPLVRMSWLREMLWRKTPRTSLGYDSLPCEQKEYLCGVGRDISFILRVTYVHRMRHTGGVEGRQYRALLALEFLSRDDAPSGETPPDQQKIEEVIQKIIQILQRKFDGDGKEVRITPPRSQSSDIPPPPKILARYLVCVPNNPELSPTGPQWGDAAFAGLSEILQCLEMNNILRVGPRGSTRDIMQARMTNFLFAVMDHCAEPGLTGEGIRDKVKVYMLDSLVQNCMRQYLRQGGGITLPDIRLGANSPPRLPDAPLTDQILCSSARPDPASDTTRGFTR